MRNRIKAAWMVLRGEWTASPPAPKFTIYVDTTAAANPSGWWIEPRSTTTGH